jgi:hypothetical protein
MDIPLKQNQKIIMAAMNPVACARLYIFMQRILFEELLGIKIETNDIKKTYPRIDESITSDTRFQNEYKRKFGIEFNELMKYDPPLGQALAIILCTEETGKNTLHGHANAQTTLKPELLESLAGHKFLEVIVCRIIDSIYKTELPASVHVRLVAVHEIGGIQKARMSRETPPEVNSNADMSQINTFGTHVAATVNLHGHITPGACDPKGKYVPRLCRMGKGSKLASNTEAVELESITDFFNNEVVYVKAVISDRLPKTFVHNREPGMGKFYK